MNESCIALTAPYEAAVVAVAQSASPEMPKRTSLPSMLPPACSALATWSTCSASKAGLPACSCDRHSQSSGRKTTNIAARTAQPWRVSFTILPNV